MKHRILQACAWAFFSVLALIIFAALATMARGADVLAPCYDAKALKGMVAMVSSTQASRVLIIANIDSGPGAAFDREQKDLIDTLRKRGCKIVYYMDARSGGDFSPLIRYDSRGNFTRILPVNAEIKTGKDLEIERQAWLRYGAPDGWMLDDASPKGMDSLYMTLSTWGKRIVLNPGRAMTPPKCLLVAPAGVVVIISETAREWPRALTPWEAANRGKCAVIGLKITQGSLPAFMASTAGLGWRWASPLDDAWREGKSAYTAVTPYLKELLK